MVVTTDEDQPFPDRRVVILGASNVTRALPTVIRCARDVWGVPLDFVAAVGHGRGYGVSSCVLGRTLPSILRCQLWTALEQLPPRPTATLITDVGNDLLYGATARQIVRWIERCLEWLVQSSDQIIITELPLAGLVALSERRFRVLRRLLFPGSGISRPSAIDAAREINRQLGTLSGYYRAQLVTPSREWYGWDPIHIRRRYELSAWNSILGKWRKSDVAARQLRVPQRVRWMRPCEQSLFGFQQLQTQPAGQLNDGTRLSFY